MRVCVLQEVVSIFQHPALQNLAADLARAIDPSSPVAGAYTGSPLHQDSQHSVALSAKFEPRGGAASRGDWCAKRWVSVERAAIVSCDEATRVAGGWPTVSNGGDLRAGSDQRELRSSEEGSSTAPATTAASVVGLWAQRLTGRRSGSFAATGSETEETSLQPADAQAPAST